MFTVAFSQRNWSNLSVAHKDNYDNTVYSYFFFPFSSSYINSSMCWRFGHHDRAVTTSAQWIEFISYSSFVSSFFLSFAEKNSSIFQFSTSVFIYWFLIQVGQILTKPQLDSAKNVRFYLVNLFNQEFRVMFGTASIPSIILIRIDERIPASFVTCHVAWHGSCELRPRELVVKALWLDMLPCGFIHRE